jgi:hypothetical protein
MRMTLRTTILRSAFLLSAVALLAQGGDSSRSRPEPERVPDRERKPVAAQREAPSAPSAADIRRSRAARLEATLAGLERKQRAVSLEIEQIRARRDSFDHAHRVLLDEHAQVARALLKQQLMTPAASLLLLPAEHRRLALKERLFQRYAAGQRLRAERIAASSQLLARQDRLLRDRELEQKMLVARKRAEIAAVLAEPDGAKAEE